MHEGWTDEREGKVVEWAAARAAIMLITTAASATVSFEFCS